MLERKPILADWPGPWFAWARSYSYKNYWRVQDNLGEMEDVLAECGLIYAQCRKRYGATVNSPAHFMRLYQMCIISAFHDHSNKQTKRRKLEVSYHPVEATVGDSMLAAKIAGASRELQEVLSILMGAPREVLVTLHADGKVPAEIMLKRIGQYCNAAHPEQIASELQALLT